MLTFSTVIRPVFVLTARTLPDLPFSRPAMISTVSFLRIESFFGTSMCIIKTSQHLRSQRDDLRERARAKFASDWSEDTSPDRLVLGVDQNRRVRIETDIGPV